MRKNYTNEMLDNIVADKLFFKLGTKEISEKTGFSRAFIDATVATYRRVSEGDWEKVAFMLSGAQMQLRVVEWAAAKCGITVPESFYPKAEPPAEPPAEPKDETYQVGKKDGTKVDFGNGANNTLHALIDAINKNTAAVNGLMGLINGIKS